MSKQQIIPKASKPLDIPKKSIKIKPAQEEVIIVGSVGSGEREAWAQSFLQQIKIKADGKSQETEIMGERDEDVDDF